MRPKYPTGRVAVVCLALLVSVGPALIPSAAFADGPTVGVETTNDTVDHVIEQIVSGTGFAPSSDVLVSVTTGATCAAPITTVWSRTVVAASDGTFVAYPLFAIPAASGDGIVCAQSGSSVAQIGFTWLSFTMSITADCTHAYTQFSYMGLQANVVGGGLPPDARYVAELGDIADGVGAVDSFEVGPSAPDGSLSWTGPVSATNSKAWKSGFQDWTIGDGIHAFVVGSAVLPSGACDTSPPAVSLQVPRVTTLDNSTTVSWTASDDRSGVVAYQLRYRSANSVSRLGAWVYPVSWQSLTATSEKSTGLSPGHEYCYSVRARDGAGNWSAWTAPGCTVVPLDDRSLTADAAWTRISGSYFWQSTATASSSYGASLTLETARVTSLALVATKCASCGLVWIYFNGTRYTLNLASSTTTYRAIIPVPGIHPGVGTVTIEDAVRGKIVQIDGVAIGET